MLPCAAHFWAPPHPTALWSSTALSPPWPPCAPPKLCPTAVSYFIPSHASYEVGYRKAMEAMDLEPIFLLGMRLGEGSGCPLAFRVLDAACAVLSHMATFDQAGINDEYLDPIRQGDQFSVEVEA